MLINRRTFLIASTATAIGLAAPFAPAFAQDKNITVAFSQAELVNDWRVTNQKDMADHVTQKGWKFITASGDGDPAKQLSDIQSLLAQRPTVLVVAPLESVALAPAAALADDAGVPMIVIDRTLAAEPGQGQYKVEIVQSHYNSGKLLAEKTVELLKAKNGAPKGNVVRVGGSPGSSPVIDAGKGWDDVMKAYPDIKVVGTANGSFTKEGGIRVMQDFLQRFPKGQIDAVWSDYSDMTMGAIQAIKDAGRTEILGNIVGEGGQISALEAVVRGEIARETQTLRILAIWSWTTWQSWQLGSRLKRARTCRSRFSMLTRRTRRASISTRSRRLEPNSNARHRSGSADTVAAWNQQILRTCECFAGRFLRLLAGRSPLPDGRKRRGQVYADQNGIEVPYSRMPDRLNSWKCQIAMTPQRHASAALQRSIKSLT